jgi:hypothetical protein
VQCSYGSWRTRVLNGIRVVTLPGLGHGGWLVDADAPTVIARRVRALSYETDLVDAVRAATERPATSINGRAMRDQLRAARVETLHALEHLQGALSTRAARGAQTVGGAVSAAERAAREQLGEVQAALRELRAAAPDAAAAAGHRKELQGHKELQELQDLATKLEQAWRAFR